ncbi:hypothetical protein WSM22_04200 [Cytophagales bacterium WSM2-2]|nr:hypothetical protein WSM22_04200 [Cytophagales bacterium WSM2-2]
MKQLFLVSIVVVILLSCSSPKDEFRNYLNSIETIQAPSNLEAELRKVRSKNYDTVLFARFEHDKGKDSRKPHGKLFENDSIILIIEGTDLSSIGGAVGYQLVDPILFTFDREGHKLDSLNPYSSFSQTEYGYQCTEFVTLEKNKQISIIDSIKLWAFNKKNSEIIPGSEKLTVDSVVYKIDGKGKFRIIKGKLKKELVREETKKSWRLKMKRG